MTATGPDSDPGSASTSPWWSSDGDRVDPAQDPLEAHLAARGLHAVDDPDRDPPGGEQSAESPNPPRSGDSGPADAPAGAPGTKDTGPATSGTDDGPSDGASRSERAHAPGICGVCPICRGHAVLQERHPEVAAHLADAARSLSAALSTFADLVDAEAPDEDGPGPGTDEFRPIALDDEEGEA